MSGEFCRKKMMVSLFCLLMIVSNIRVWGAAAQPDELWAKAVKLAGENQLLFPGNIYGLAQELDKRGNIKNTEESWIRGTETDDGQITFSEVKKLQNGKDVTAIQKNSKQDPNNYNLDLSDLTLPFNPNVQSLITINRLDQPELKDGQRCVAYDFRCPTPKGDTMVGRAWLSDTGVPVAMSYTFTPLSKRVWKQVFDLTNEVYFRYERNGLWYPEKVHIEIKSKTWLSASIHQLNYTFSDYWKYQQPLVSAITTGGKPILPLAKVTVPFDYNGYLIVKVRLNDEDQEYRFLLDTGASVTVIDPQVASAFNFAKQSDFNMDDGYTSKKADLVIVKKISMGEVAVENSGAVIESLDKLESSGLKVDGILGSNFLRFFKIKFDYEQHQLTFYGNSDDIAAETASFLKIPLIQGETGIIFAPFKIPGSANPFKAEIDTGSGGCITGNSKFLDAFRPALNSKIIQSQGATGGGMFGRSSQILSRLAEFTIGDLEIKNLPIYFNNNWKFEFLILGNGFWSYFTMIIDYPRSVMYLLPLKDKIMDKNIYAYGFTIGEGVDGQIQVTGIWKGSAADRAGLRIGDVILRMDANDEFRASYEECKRLMDESNTIHLLVQRGSREKEININKAPLLPEVNES